MLFYVHLQLLRPLRAAGTTAGISARAGGHASSFSVLSCPQGAPTINLARPKVKNSPLYLEAGTGRGLLRPQGEMAALDDRAGELQLGGGLPTDHFLHGVSADQPNNLHRPAPKRRRGMCDQVGKHGHAPRGKRTPDACSGTVKGPCGPRAGYRDPASHKFSPSLPEESRKGRRGGRNWPPLSAAEENLCSI